MSIGRSATQKPASRPVWRAAGCVVEALESRRLLTGMTAASFAYIYSKNMLAYAFDQNVADDLSLSDWEFHNLTTNSTVDRETAQLTDIGGGSQWLITFPGQTGSVSALVPDGNYDSILSEQGLPGLASEHKLSSLHLTADLNHDRAVGFNDWSTFNAHYNQLGPWTWADGDLDYDGNVDFNDWSGSVSTLPKFGAS